MEKSLVAQGKTVAAALDKAAVLLHCDTSRVAYEILQESSPSRGVLCKLRVIEVAPSVAELTPQGDDGSEFDAPMPWLAGTLAPLAPDAFCKALEDAFTRSLEEQPTHAEDAPPAAADNPLLEIRDGVSAGTGHIAHTGDIRIRGNVLKGARIKASGSIHVVGDVETAYLEAGGDIVITGGFLGTARTSHGRISCKFLQGAQLEAPRGSIVIQENALHSIIQAGRSVVVRDILLGGSCYGCDFVEARTAGSESGVPTVIIAGHNKRIQDRVDAIRARAERNVRLLGECQRLRDSLLPVEERGDELPIADRVRLWTAALRKGRIHADLMRLSAEKSSLLGMINGSRASRVSVTDRIYPNVKVFVDDAPLEVRSVTQFASFTKDYETGRIRVTSYQ